MQGFNDLMQIDVEAVAQTPKGQKKNNRQPRKQGLEKQAHKQPKQGAKKHCSPRSTSNAANLPVNGHQEPIIPLPMMWTPQTVSFVSHNFDLQFNNTFDWWKNYHAIPLFVRFDSDVLSHISLTEPGLIQPKQIFFVDPSEGTGGFVPLSDSVSPIRKSLQNMLRNQSSGLLSDTWSVPLSHWNLIEATLPTYTKKTKARLTYEINDTSLLVELLGPDWWYAAFKVGTSIRLRNFPSFAKCHPVWKSVPLTSTFVQMTNLLTNQSLVPQHPRQKHKERKKKAEPINPSEIPLHQAPGADIWSVLPLELWMDIFIMSIAEWFHKKIFDEKGNLVREIALKDEEIRPAVRAIESINTPLRSVFVNGNSLCWRALYEKMWELPPQLANIDRFGSWRAMVHHRLSRRFNSWVWIQEAKILYSFTTQKLTLKIKKTRFGEANNEL